MYYVLIMVPYIPQIFLSLVGNVNTYLKKEMVIWKIFIHVYVEAIFIVTFFLKIFFHFNFEAFFISLVIITFKMFLSQDLRL